MAEPRELEIKLLALSGEQLDALASRGRLGVFRIEPSGRRTQEDLYLDTEEFRLYRAGLSYRLRQKETGHTATMKQILPPGSRPLLADRTESGADGAALAADPTSIPASPFADRIGPLVGKRPLLELVRIRTDRTIARVFRDEVEVAEMALDRVEILTGDGQQRGGFFEMEIESRGADPDDLVAAGTECVDDLGFLPSTLSKFERGLAAMGVLSEARGTSRIFNLTVVPADRLVDAGYRIFRKHFERMKANEPGTRIGRDPEFLHDMRVSTRRLRAAFRVFRDAFPQPRLAAFSAEFKWIAAVLGRVRDLDVYLLKFPAYSAAVPAADREALAPFQAHLEKEWIAARKALIRALETKRYEGLLRKFEAFLDRGAPHRPAQPAARELVTVAAPRLVGKTLKKVLKFGRGISLEDPVPDDLHRLRIFCKRLRYCCEYFSDLYGKPLKKFIKKVVNLQDLLGDHQDACVAGESLRAYAGKLAAGKRANLLTALSLGQLIRSQDQAAAYEREGFAAAWKVFDRKSVRRAMWGE